VESVRYIVIALAAVDFLLLLVRPRLGFLGLILLLPFVNRFIPRLGPGLNAETFLFAAAFGGILLQARTILPSLRVIGPFAFYYASVLFAFGLLLTWPEFERHGGDPIEWAKDLKANLWPSLLFFIAYALAPTRSSRRVAMNCLVVAVLLFALSGIVDYRGGVRPNDFGVRYRAAGLLSENPNHLGASLAAFCIVPLIIALDRRRSMPMRGLNAGVYVLAVLVTILTQSRGAWLALLAGHGVWLFLTHRKLVIPAAAIGVTVLVVGYSASLLPAIVSDRIEATITPGRSVYRSGGLAGKFQPSIGIRIAYHKMGAEMFMDSPLYGHGYASFPLLTREYGLKYGVWRNRQTQTSAESMFLMVAADHGLMGYLGLLWMSWMLLSRALGLARRGGEETHLAVMFVSVFFAVVASSATQTALLRHEISLPFWLLAGLMVRAFYDHAPESEPEPDAQRIAVGTFEPQRLA